MSAAAASGPAISRWLRALRRPLRREAGRTPPPVERPPVRGTGERVRLLVVSPYYFHPMRHGAAVRAVELLRRLAADCDIHALIAIGGTDDPAQREFLSSFCRSVHFHPTGLDRPGGGAADLPSRARALATWSFAQRIRGLAFAHEIDVVQLENTDVAMFAGLPSPARSILVELDLTFRSVARRSSVYGEREEAPERAEEPLWLSLERAAWSACDQVHFVSATDREGAIEAFPSIAARARVVPNGAALAPSDGSVLVEPDAGARSVLFVGSFPHAPNREALRFLAREIWPRVRHLDPACELLVVGAGVPDWVTALDGREGIRIVGEAESVAPWYRRSAVSVVPILSGSGTRLKILESLALGVPVVSTRIGAEGLDGLGEGVGLALADDPELFARRVVELVTEPERRRELVRRGRDVVAERYDWDRIAAEALRCYRELPATLSPRETVLADSRGEPEPAITVVVDALGKGADPAPLLRALADQVEQRFETVILLPQLASTVEVPEALVGRVAQLACPDLPYGPGRRARAALRAARGQILVFLDARMELSGREWLAHLTWPLFQPLPPTAVEGVAVDGMGMRVAGPRFHDASDDDGGDLPQEGTGFSFRCSAVRRAQLATLPPPGEGELAALAWTLLVIRTGGWILQEPKVRARLLGPDEAPALATPRVEVVGGPRLSVVVCTRDRAYDVERTLRSLASQRAEVAWEVLVVDNGSEDDTLERVARAARVSETPIRSVVEPVVGLSAARNAGARMAEGEWLLFLDDDAAPAPGWLAEYALLLDRPDIAGAGGPVDAWLSGDLPFWLGHEYLPYLSVWDLGPVARELRYNEYPRGANMAVRRRELLELGGFSRQLGRSGRSLRSCEEIELFLQLEHAGRRIVYLPAARVFHRVRAERLNADWLRRRYAAQGFSEAIIDWRHGGLARLREVWRGLGPPAESGPADGLPRDLDRSFRDAARRAYRRGALYAIAAVARLRDGAFASPRSGVDARR